MDVLQSAIGKVWRYCVLILVLELLLTARTGGRPSNHAEIPSEDVDYCKLNDEINELCQRCAKLTESNVVYPMCCRNTEGVMDWCEQYVNFGVRGS